MNHPSQNSKIKKNFLIATIILFTTSFHSMYAQSAALLSQEERIATGFNKINISGAFKVILVQGTTEGVKLEAPPEILKNIKTKVEKESLEISLSNNTKSYGNIMVTINFINIESMDCSGSTNISTAGQVHLDKFDFNAVGSSKADFDIVTKKLDVDLGGSGHITLKGSANQVDLDISGSGKYLAGSLVADKYEIDVSGSGSAEITVTSNLDISISGAGVIKYKGDPKITQDISGSGRVEKF